MLIRLDMRAGHSFTKGFKRPFDEVFMKTMQETAKYLCENVMNCKLAYVQSDEITLVLIDYEKLNTEAFFDYRVDKLCSIAASMATMAFNKFFRKNVDEWGYNNLPNYSEGGTNEPVDEELMRLCDCYWKSIEKGAMFDARVFNIPKEEVTNCLYWRQLDCSRNSVQMVGQANFSHKELQNKSCNVIQDMLMTEKGINWNNYPTHQKRGSCCVKMYQIDEDCWQSHAEDKLMLNGRTRWDIDTEIPIFKDEHRSYVERLINFNT